MKYRPFSFLLTGLIFAVIGTFFISHTPPLAAPKPNIVFIFADDLGWGDLSSYGATDLKTPHIDSLLQSGLRFTNFYANSPVCSPSRAALLSGRWPEAMGVPGVIRDDLADSWGYLAPGLLLPNYLQKAGYHTALVGKWHLGLEPENAPNERGFQEFYGFLGDMMDDYYTKRRNGHNFMRHNRQVIDPPGHATEVFTEGAIRYVNSRKNNPKPFFLYLAYNAPHNPLQPPADWLDRVKKREPTIDPTRAKLVALIEHLDANIGRLLATLKANRQLENTLIVFTSDNGGWGPAKANNGPYRAFKGTMYEGGIRIPAGIAWTGHIQPGRVSDERGQLSDWMPTFLELAGQQATMPVDGKSLVPVFLTNQPDAQKLDLLRQRPLFYIRREGNDAFKGLTTQAVRLGDWKLLQPSPFLPFELYNLKDDPKETTDLSKQEKAKANELTRLLMNHIQLGGAVPWQKRK
ncbi:sulfatase-like hydrolase/transferase [Larkinella humicola]|uniref:Sulfatase-like hydrolase/transferase n=1 Tax=Larkinella humicola TaxID=2607654 RepID=A0A5N1JLA5_9BACT|nr:sulfatase-like hydrolase/transferase [Larkinella humicola]KAA9356901.1 sulfatase-like hydrolase/transferase [Larkinella humicola]